MSARRSTVASLDKFLDATATDPFVISGEENTICNVIQKILSGLEIMGAGIVKKQMKLGETENKTDK